MGATTLALYGVGGAAVATSLVKLRRRSNCRKPSTGRSPAMPAWRGGLPALVPFYEYDEARFFCSDGAPADDRGNAAAPASRGCRRFTETRFAETIRRTAEAAE